MTLTIKVNCGKIKAIVGYTSWAIITGVLVFLLWTVVDTALYHTTYQSDGWACYNGFWDKKDNGTCLPSNGGVIIPLLILGPISAFNFYVIWLFLNDKFKLVKIECTDKSNNDESFKFLDYHPSSGRILEKRD